MLSLPRQPRVFTNRYSTIGSVANDTLFLRKNFEHTDFEHEEAFGEQALWRAVITQALMDAGSNSLKKEARIFKHRAIAWFSKRNKDFQSVCALAGLDAGYVMEKAKAAIANSCKWRSEQGKKVKSKKTRS